MHSSIIMHELTNWVRSGLGTTMPNPSVASALLINQNLIGIGVHYGAGFAHSEVNTLRYGHGKELGGGELYITLEPCAHTGRTPPCTDAIIQAGIKRVVYGYRDPHVLVQGKGIATLQRAGIQCIYCPVETLDHLYQPYAHWCKTGQPWVTAKLAISAEGAVAGVGGKPIAITSQLFNDWVHAQRKQSDLILATGKTILSDNPQLNARYQGECIGKPLAILDKKGTVPLNALCLERASQVLMYTACFNQAVYEKQGIECINLFSTEDKLNLSLLLKDLGKRGFHTVWVEAGPTLFMALCEQKLVNRAVLAKSSHSLGPHAKPTLAKTFDITQGSKTSQTYQMGPDKVTLVDF